MTSREDHRERGGKEEVDVSQSRGERCSIRGDVRGVWIGALVEGWQGRTCIAWLSGSRDIVAGKKGGEGNPKDTVTIGGDGRDENAARKEDTLKTPEMQRWGGRVRVPADSPPTQDMLPHASVDVRG
nr:hypothetical protein CFP56_52380 [Quercus suber]